MSFFDVTSGPSLAFPTVGSKAGGTIAAPYTERQATDFGTDKPKVDSKGGAVMMACVPIQTTEREVSIPNDDGIRTLYVEKVGMKIAIGEALKLAGAPDLEVGGQLWVTWAGETPSTKGNPLKTWTAEYTRPVGSLGVAPTPAAAPAATPATPAPPAPPAQPQLPIPAATAPAPAANGANIDGLAKVKKLVGAGFGPAEIHELVPEMSLDMIAAIANI